MSVALRLALTVAIGVAACGRLGYEPIGDGDASGAVVDSGTEVTDGTPGSTDAPRAGADAGEEGTCIITPPDENCSCSDGESCSFPCSEEVTECSAMCDSVSSCDLDCRGVGDCTLRCFAGSSCTLYCDTGTCSVTNCADADGRCDLRCTAGGCSIS